MHCIHSGITELGGIPLASIVFKAFLICFSGRCFFFFPLILENISRYGPKENTMPNLYNTYRLYTFQQWASLPALTLFLSVQEKRKNGNSRGNSSMKFS